MRFDRRSQTIQAFFFAATAAGFCAVGNYNVAAHCFLALDNVIFSLANDANPYGQHRPLIGTGYTDITNISALIGFLAVVNYQANGIEPAPLFHKLVLGLHSVATVANLYHSSANIIPFFRQLLGRAAPLPAATPVHEAPGLGLN